MVILTGIKDIRKRISKQALVQAKEQIKSNSAGDTKKSKEETNTNLEVISIILVGQRPPARGPASATLTGALAAGHRSTIEIYNLASEGNADQALVKLTTLVGGKFAASMVPEEKHLRKWVVKQHKNH